MSTSTSNRKSVHAAAGRFASTQWSLALAAGRRSTPDAEQALAKLCGAYWPPIYAYLRRRGYLAPKRSARVLAGRLRATHLPARTRALRWMQLILKDHKPTVGVKCFYCHVSDDSTSQRRQIVRKLNRR